jgi:hypothetical protein
VSGQPGPFEIVYAAQVGQQIAALPRQARAALAGTLERLAGDPWAGTSPD